MIVAWTLALGLALQDDPELEELKRKAAEEKQQEQQGLPERVSKLEKQNEELKKMFKFEDGLKFSLPDGNFTAHVGGRLLAHLRWISDRPDSARTSPDTFFVKQARIEVSGTFFKDYEFKVQVDFPNGSGTSTTGTLQDGYLGWKKFEAFAVRIGQFKEPFSQEETTSTRFIDFDERSVANRLTPGRDVGIAFHGKLFENLLEYELGFFNGAGRAVVDTNDEKDFAIRVRVNPFVNSDVEILKKLRFGIAFTIGDVDSAGSGPLDFRTTELAVLFLDATAGSVDGTRTRIGLELSWLYKSFSFRAEWMRRSDEVDIGASEDEDIDMDGWYIAITWIVTGEDKPLENRIKPNAPFDIEKGDWGAFELAFRVAQLSVDDDIFDLGIASAAANSNEVLTITFGVNWYLTRNFRVSPNIVFERYDDDVVFSAGREEDSAWGFLWRFQIDF